MHTMFLYAICTDPFSYRIYIVLQNHLSSSVTLRL